MKIKTGKILDLLAKRARYEDKNYEKIPHEKRMLAITPDTGIFYNSLIRATKTKRILEIGLSVGYSTIWFAEALPNNGKIISIEQNPDKIKRAKQNFVQAGVSKKIKIRQGNAKQVLQEMLSEFRKKRILFDFVFIDADKENYPFYFQAGLAMLKKGGIVCADNILYPTRYQKSIKKYLALVKKTPNTMTTIIPIGNGQQFTVKTK